MPGKHGGRLSVPMKDILGNFKFLVIETENQIKLTHGLLSGFNLELLEKIGSKDDYIDNLKTTIENACFFKGRFNSFKHR